MRLGADTWNPHVPLYKGGYYSDPHYIDEEMKVQGEEVPCPM